MRASKPPTQRQLRVGEEIRHLLAHSFSLRHSGDPLLDKSTIPVTEARISPDLQNATVFIVPLCGQFIKEILDALKEISWFFRKDIARQLKTRVVPRLVFQQDISFDQAQRINTLLKS